LKRPGVPLIAIANDVLLSAGSVRTNLPLSPSREASSTQSPQPRLLDLIDNLLRLHLKKNLTQPLVASGCQVVAYVLGIYLAATPQNDSLLLAVEGYLAIIRHRLARDRLTIKKALYRLPLSQKRLNNFRGIVWLSPAVKYAIRFQRYKRALLTETMATGPLDLNFSLQS
jgi:hypothetical protein